MKSVKVQRVAMIAIAIGTSFLTVSCNDNKVSQCAKTIEVVNRTVLDTKAISDSGTKGDVQTIDKLVEIFDKASKDLDGVNVKDEKLKVYKSQFLTMYQGATDITKQLIVSLKEKKSSKVNEGLRKYANIVSPERDLVAVLNQYCKEPEKK
jgi:hypothetical protein